MFDRSHEIANHLRSIRTAVWILAWLAIISTVLGIGSTLAIGLLGVSLF